MAVRNSLVGDVLHHAKADGIVELVHVPGIVGGLARSPAFEDRDRQAAAGGDLLRHHQAGPAAAHDSHVDWFEVFHNVRSESLSLEYRPRGGAGAAAV